jgi:hemoglobin
MIEARKDIHSAEDIKVMVDAFYEKVNADPLLSPVFNAVAQVNWETHLPVMYSFWAKLLFGDLTYQGQPFPKHLPLPVREAHFERWLLLFKQTVDELFVGSRAEEAKSKATSIANIFKVRILGPKILP